MTDSFEDAVRGRIDSPGSDKTVVGVAGTPFPNNEKESLLVTYVVDPAGSRITFTNDFEEDVGRKINGRGEFGDYTVKVHKTGRSSAKPFRQQAVTVTVPAEDLPTSNGDLSRIARIIERNRDGLVVDDWIIDMEGRP